MRPNRQINVCIRYEIPGCKAWITKTSWCTAILTWLTRRLSSVITRPRFRFSNIRFGKCDQLSMVPSLGFTPIVSSLDIEGEIKTLCSPKKKRSECSEFYCALNIWSTASLSARNLQVGSSPQDIGRTDCFSNPEALHMAGRRAVNIRGAVFRRQDEWVEEWNRKAEGDHAQGSRNIEITLCFNAVRRSSQCNGCDYPSSYTCLIARLTRKRVSRSER